MAGVQINDSCKRANTVSISRGVTRPCCVHWAQSGGCKVAINWECGLAQVSAMRGMQDEHK